MKKGTKIVLGIVVLFLILIIMESGGSSNSTQATQSANTKSAHEEPPENASNAFEAQVQNEIEDKHLLTKETNVTYNSVTQALIIDQSEKNYLSIHLLKTTILTDTSSILEVTAKHPKEIKYVVIEYKATLLDQNRNESLDRVYLGKYYTEKTNPVNWANTYGDDQENLLKAKADSFWLHPIFSK